ncbi:MG2 domain-containing protein [Flavobacterium anhuiense]|uniref:MG2 domain-containing protein n=1 Tax=Flavobacterium anhuiense TaxID=459526 RepID=UPI003D972B21
MKNILFVFLLVSSVLFGQQNDKKWDNVIGLENEGKVKSANEIVSSIYKKAINQKDEVQMIKCFFYQSKYLQILDENAQTKIINNLKTDINRVSTPSKAILNLVYAKCLSDYYNRNNYNINQRTNVTELDDDFLKWTKSNFVSQIDLALKNSLENEAILKNTPLTKYEAIFDYSTIEKFKKLNLLNYVIAENISIQSQKIRLYEINKKDLVAYKKGFLGSANDFIKSNFDSVSNENLRVVLKLYQKQEINNPSSENIWQRILFSKTLVDFDEEYIKALTSFQKNTNDTVVIQNIQLQKAYYLNESVSKATNSDHKIKAVAILDSVIKINNKSNAYKFAIQTKDNILLKDLNVQIRKYIYNKENTRAYIQYKNVENLKISFYKISQTELQQFIKYNLPKETIKDSIVYNNKPIATKLYSLKNNKDYLQYSTEVILPKLETGSYLVYFESESSSENLKASAFETITVSNFIVIASQNNVSENYQVLDRKTGQPLENVAITSPSFNIKTDKNGMAVFKKVNIQNFNNETITLSSSNDTLSLSKNYIQYNKEYGDKTNEKIEFDGEVKFYLDRAIYRPGQTVFYKGIAFQEIKNKASIVPYTSFDIIIEDIDSNEIKKIQATTNEFGSFSGEFALPKTGLTGNFSIRAEEPIDYEKDKIYDKEKEEHPFWENVSLKDSKTYFKVEEYKRPKFEVTFDPKKDSFKLDQAIKVHGNAKAFAGSNISDAKVTYKVIRKTNYSREYYSQESEVLETGETKTDASGKFTVDFIAIPSKNAVKEKLPVFSYDIEATVTDINGETHDAKTTIKIGYHDLELNALIANEITTKDKNEIKLTSTNLNGESKEIEGEIKIYFLAPLSSKFKSRIFPQPDIKSISDSEFEALFPYENDNLIDLKTSESLLFSKKINTPKDQNFALDFISNYTSGHYKVVFSAKDSFEI